MANQTFSFRIPAKLLKQMEITARMAGKSKTELLLEALNEYFSSSDHVLNLLGLAQKQIDFLRNKTAIQSAQLKELRQFKDECLERILALEQKAAGHEASSDRVQSNPEVQHEVRCSSSTNGARAIHDRPTSP